MAYPIPNENRRQRQRPRLIPAYLANERWQIMRLQWKLTVASLKMFTRQKEAIIWTMLLPLFMIFLFGFVSFEGLGKIRIGVAGGEDEPSGQLAGRLGEVRTVQVTRGAESSELEQLMAGKRHLVLVIPEEFDAAKGKELRVLVNDGTPEESQLGLLILRKVLDDETFRMHTAPDRVPMTLQSVASRRSSYIDFLLPGVLSLAIMQSGIFGVAFGFRCAPKTGGASPPVGDSHETPGIHRGPG